MYVCYDVFTDPSPAQVRGRPKYSTYQNFKGRKSNSMMNLHGKTLRSLMYTTSCCFCVVARCLGHEVVCPGFVGSFFLVFRFCRFSVGDGVRGSLVWIEMCDYYACIQSLFYGQRIKISEERFSYAEILWCLPGFFCCGYGCI